MAVICAQCGEELMGAVNRCWNCGQAVLSTPDADVAPPVRRLPVRLPDAAPPCPAAERESAVADESGEAPDEASDGAEVFAAEVVANEPAASPTPTSASGPTVAPRAAEYHRQGGAGAAAIVSLLLGLLALGLGGFFWPAIVIALLGVAAGVWGLRSRRKTIATVGLLCCCMGTTVSGLRLAYDSFTWIHGDPPIRVGPEEFLDDELQ